MGVCVLRIQYCRAIAKPKQHILFKYLIFKKLIAFSTTTSQYKQKTKVINL